MFMDQGEAGILKCTICKKKNDANTVFSRDFEVVSQYCKVAGGCMTSARRARASGGVRGHAPPENFLKIGPRRCNLRQFEAF